MSLDLKKGVGERRETEGAERAREGKTASFIVSQVYLAIAR